MPKLSVFDPPANQSDFPSGSSDDQALRKRWSDSINRFTEQTLQNNPWGATNQPRLTQYFNPLQVDVPSDAPEAVIGWTAFPNRINTTFPNVSQRTRWQFADDGPSQPYSPPPPRGWQDEYCEWSVKRNAAGKIIEVMFTCENREYWYTLWFVDPQKVLEIYQQILGPQVKIEDLQLLDDLGNPIIDRVTGRPGYNGRNKWNSTTTDGAMHLISNPNSLSAEIFLAGQATILRHDVNGNSITDRNQLINCSHYGTPNRNSDPTIGAEVNNLVRQGNRITLSNPVGLYIQEPDFSAYELPFTAPSGAQPSDYWTINRGRRRQGNEPHDLILHATYKVPEGHGFTVGDITINGFPIQFGAQLTETFQIALAGRAIPRISPLTDLTCSASSPDPLPQPFLLNDLDLLTMAQRSSLNMLMEPGTTVGNVGVAVASSNRNTSLEFTNAPGVSIQVTNVRSMSGGVHLFTLTITADESAPIGNQSLLATNPDGAHGPAVFGMLEIVSKGTLAGQMHVAETNLMRGRMIAEGMMHSR